MEPLEADLVFSFSYPSSSLLSSIDAAFSSPYSLARIDSIVGVKVCSMGIVKTALVDP